MWHCVNSFGKYCDGIPEWDKKPQENGAGFFGSGTCKLNPETCGRCKTSQQLWDELPQEEKDRVSKPSYVEKIAPTVKPKKEAVEKPKSKKTKETLQESLF